MSNRTHRNVSDPLRRRLEEDPALQARLDALGIVVGQETLSMDSESMIDLLVNEALDGVDLRVRYPEEFRRLLADPEQHDLFLAVLESFELIPAGQRPPEARHPAAPSARPEPVARAAAEPGVWQVQWQMAADLLDSLFLLTAGAFRSGALDEEDRWVTLVRDEVAVGALQVLVVLDGRLDDDDSLIPTLHLVADAADEPLEAWGRLTWGSQVLEIQPTLAAGTPLPAVPLKDLLHPDRQSFRASLSLDLFIRAAARDG